ncbi:hypothetical protein Pla52o_19600 [Novipirellula galeiformis]|uniref:Tetratricopeptide repeat protein n=2 Tax=Novipirellula galeiformis TaxID=2528004 RepID=A0A5C6CKE8_9BACT|nr:hypothetical protein Pla52o_19600 [Novipirellula galeiformis]
MKRHRSIGAMLILLLLSGCAAPLRKIDVARDAFATGDLDKSHTTFSELAQSRRRFGDAAALDLAMVELARGDAAAAEARLRKLRDQFDALPKVAPLHETAAIITDDTARAYQPAGYEQVMIRAMLAVCSLATGGEDAESYAIQAAMRQNELADEAGKRGLASASETYQPIALAPYLRGVLREATHHDYDDAVRAYELVTSVEPNFAPAHADVVRASVGAHSAPGHGVLYVIACVGRGPVLEQVDAPTTSSAMQIASAVINVQANEKGGESRAMALPNIATVKVPQVMIPPSNAVAVGVRSGGVGIGVTQTLTDVAELAKRQVAAEMPWTIARAVIRRATKETTVAMTGNQLGLSGAAGSLFQFAVASAWGSVENADTRCWGLLPREIQVLRVELPVGDHEISLHSLGMRGEPMGMGVTKQVTMVDGHNEYMIVIAPDQMIYRVN